MKCDYCDKVIEDGEKFYITDDEEVYCSCCVEERTITYYICDGENIGSDNEIATYNDIELATKDIKSNIEFLQDAIIKLKNYMIKYPDRKEHYNFLINTKKDDIKKQEDLLKKLFDKE